jgi:peroxiredoxin
MCYIKGITVMLVLIFATTASIAATLGAPAPTFALKDTYGEVIRLTDFRGKYVVLEWFNPDCPAVKRHYRDDTMVDLARYYQTRHVVWLSINSTFYMQQEDNIIWKHINQLSYYILSDPSGQVGKLYQAEVTPQLYIIDPNGLLIYQGAIDDDPYGDKMQPLNYVQMALEEVLAGRSIQQPQTRAYGCWVKYAD